MRRANNSEEHGSVDQLAEVLLPIASVMIEGKLSAAVLINAAKVAYVQAAIAKHRPEGKRINISRLSVVTGLTRKEVASLIQVHTRSTAARSNTRRMDHRALRVLRGWITDPLYLTSIGKPASLSVTGEERSFSSLVRAYGGDVTPIAVLRELEKLGAVARTSKGRLLPRVRTARPLLHSANQIREFARILAGFSGTASQLVTPNRPSLFFGFKERNVISESQAAKFCDVFGRRAALLLDSFEDWYERSVSKHRRVRVRSKPSSQTIGLGVYLVSKQPGQR